MKNRRLKPPSLAQRMLLRFLKDELAEEVIGDLDEKFKAVAKRRSALFAKLDYWYQVFQYLRPFAVRKSRPIHLTQNALLINHFKISWRYLLNNTSFSSINIAGLAIGMASATLILLWIADEVSVDTFHEKRDRIYQVFNRAEIDGDTRVWSGTSHLLAPVMETNYQEIEKITRVVWAAAFIFHVGDKHLNSEGFVTDAAFLEMFSFPFVRGDAKTALSSPRSIVLTETMAKKLFGDEEALGKTVRVDSTALFTVTGVLKDLPRNTQFHFEYLLPWSFMKEVHWEIAEWHDYSTPTYLLLKPGITEEAANNLFKNTLKKYAGDAKTELFVYPMEKWWLWSHFENGKPSGGRIDNVKLFGIIAGFILFIACINYMNLSTSRSIKRGREIGISKVVGASRTSLVVRFLSESILIALLAGVVALILVQLNLSWFSELTYKQLSLPYTSVSFWLYTLAFILFTGILAGSYPALHLSSYKTLTVLKGVMKVSRSPIAPRKLLVIVQFTFAIILITCTTVVYRQILFGQNRDLGYDKQNLVYVFMQGELQKNYQAIKHELINSGAVTSVMRTNSPITDIWNWDDSYQWEGKDPNLKKGMIKLHADADFTKTVGLTIIAGRDIDIQTYPADSSAILLSESAVQLMGFTHPIGQHVESREGKWHVVGVIKDFVAGAPYAPVFPIVVQGPGPHNWFGTITFRLNPQNSITENMESVASVFRKYNPEQSFTHFFVDENLSSRFNYEELVAKLAALFAGLAIFISCLGLFALAAFVIESRIKEIGVRKVLGASVISISTLLSKDFLKLVLISFVIACPIAWWNMDQWLQNYHYRAPISWWIFGVTGLLSIVISLVTISFQSIRAALANPVKSLKTE